MFLGETKIYITLKHTFILEKSKLSKKKCLET
jgi:hypothetical protein